MTRQGDRVAEDRTTKRNKKLVRALEFELSNVLEAQGMVLLGFSMKIEEWECLMTIRTLRGEDRIVAFVGSDTISNCIVKAVSVIQREKVPWREDKYR